MSIHGSNKLSIVPYPLVQQHSYTKVNIVATKHNPMFIKPQRFLAISTLLLASMQLCIATAKTNTLTSNEIMQSVISSIKDSTNIIQKTGFEGTEDIHWVMEDGSNIMIYNTTQAYLSTGIYSLKDEDTPETKLLINKHRTLLLKNLKNIMYKYGYIINLKSTNTHLPEKENDEDNVAFNAYLLSFQKDDIVCQLDLMPYRELLDEPILRISQAKNEVLRTYSFTCSDQLQTSYRIQKPFLDAIKKYSIQRKYPIIPYSLLIMKERDGFYQIYIRHRGGGINSVMKKEGDEYKVLWMNADTIPCELPMKYKVPAYIFEDCHRKSQNGFEVFTYQDEEGTVVNRFFENQ